MPRINVFIDGSWLYHNRPRLAAAAGTPRYRMDYGKVPQVLVEEIGRQLGPTEGGLVLGEGCIYGSVPVNHHAADDDLVLKRQRFYEMLGDRYGFNVKIFPIDYRGRRIRKHHRAPDDSFQPREKCVDMALGIDLVARVTPDAILRDNVVGDDIAAVAGGDKDFVPALQEARRRGARIAIASIRGSCSRALADSADPDGVRDFRMIWLDDLVDRLALKLYRQHCCSEFHIGDRRVMTPMRPHPGQRFYCSECRAKYAAWCDSPDAA